MGWLAQEQIAKSGQMMPTKNAKRESKMRYFIITAIILCSSILCGMGLFVRPKGYLYLIPEGFTGTVYLTYSVKDSPELKQTDGYYVVKFPQDGSLVTSSAPLPGQDHDEYWIYSGENRYKLPPEKIGGGGTKAYVNSSGERILKTYFTILKW